MLINLTDIFTCEGKDRRESIDYGPREFPYMGSSYPICEKSPAAMHFINTGTGQALVQGSIRIVLEIPCDRCLQTVRTPLEVTFEQELFSPEETGRMEDADGQEFMQGYELDTEAFLSNEILINMPVKILCRPDCRGICKKCGHNLNQGDCGCDTFIPDPRMAAIKDIFNASKEV